MKPFVLSLRYGEQPLRKAVAWFVRGGAPGEWLAEVAGWGVPLADLMLYVVPRSARDLRPLGVLVISPGDARPVVSARAVPYGRISERFYLPVTASLSPPAAESELAGLPASEIEVGVWHPAAGLVGFERGEGRRCSQLLEPPPHVASDWSHARPGVTINQRLRSVLPAESPSAESILDEGRDDIGTQPNDLSQLPELPDEPRPGMLKRLGAAALASAARAGQWLLTFLPQSASAPNWADQMRNWLGNVARTAAAQMELLSARERELRRLLHLLATDPDQGLKFALPFGGGDHRGVGPPSGKLAPHDVNFNLDHLRGGGPVDLWNVSAPIQHDLLREYRRLAERELRLGRHRRAAYIFAELVNDLAAAAATLAAGGHFREAAVLYRDRLKNPLEAARCLEQGRLWAEALVAYEELGEYERAGDLARRLDQPDDADRLFRQAVSAAVARGDVLATAGLLDQKLQCPNEALEHLARGWKSNSQSRQCVAETLRFLGRLGRHAEAVRQLERFSGSEFSPGQYRNFVDVLTNAAWTYPDPPVREAAADMVRVMAALRLKLSSREESKVLLGAVRRLAPEDRLLERDCQRFLDQAPRAVRPARIGAPNAIPEIGLVRELRLGELAGCVAAAGTDSFYYAAGYSRAGRLCVARGHREDLAWWTEVEWDVPDPRSPLILVPNSISSSAASARTVVVHLVNQTKIHLPEKRFRGDDLRHHSDPAGTPPWTTEETVAIADAGNGTTWALQWTRSGLVLAGYGAGPVTLASQPLDFPPDFLAEAFADQAPTVPVPMQVRESRFYIGLGDRLVIAHRNGPTEIVKMLAPIRGLACSAPHTRRRLAVTFESGGRVIWDEMRDRHQAGFATNFGTLVAGFTRLGWLIAAAGDECHVYSTNDRQIRLAAECRWPSAEPIAVLDTGTVHEFAVCFADGTLRIYRIPQRTM